MRRTPTPSPIRSRGVRYCRRHPDEVPENLANSLLALLHSCRLRLILDGTSARDLAVEVDRCLALPDHVVLKQGPIVYAARALLRGEGEDGHERVERLVRRLGSQCAGIEDVESRSWLTSHLGTLCGLLAVREPSWTTKAHEYHRQAVELMLAAGRTVHPRNQLHLGEAALRRAKDSAERDPDEVEALLRESISMLSGLLKRPDVLISPEGAGAEDETVFVVPERRVASLLGEDYLRLHSVTRTRADVTTAIKWLERSQELGNESADAAGRLADAYYRRGRETSSADDYRRAIDGKRIARERDHGSRENWSVSGACHAALWHLSSDPEEFAEAVTAMLAATEVDPLWPWPFMQLAQLLSETGAPLCEVDHDGERKDVPALLAHAARLAIRTPEFRQKVLGGRSETFVLDDPHRLLSATLVLKPTTRADATIERQRTTSLKRHLVATGAPDWMVVPEPLTEVRLDAPGDADTVYATRRAKGTSLAELAAHCPDKVNWHVPRVVRYLARIHGWLENETARARGDHWAAVRSVVAEYGARIGVPDPDHLGAVVAGAVPHTLPAVARRDAHAENWLVTPSSQIVALDLEGDDDLPLLYEVAQLVEDHALVPLESDGWSLRAGLCQTYLHEFGYASLHAADVEAAYQAFALTRAVFVVGHVPRKVDRSSPSGSRRFAADRVHHAIKVVEWVAATAVPPLAKAARELSGPLRATCDVVLGELD